MSKVIDWSGVEVAYRAGGKTLRDIAASFGVSHVAISKHAKKKGWTRGDVPAPRRGIAVNEITRDERVRPGFVYVVKAEECRLSKIGLTANLAERLSAHQTSSPVELRISIAYFVENMRQEERALHELFAAKRARGEWFDLDRSDLEMIATRSLRS